MKQKNIDIWNGLKGLLTAKADEFIKSVGVVKPDIIYQVYPSGKIGIGNVTGIHYSYHLNGRYFSVEYFTKIPTKKDIERLRDFVTINPPMEKKYIAFSYKEDLGSSVHFLYDDTNNKILTVSESEANELSEKKKLESDIKKQFQLDHAKDANYDYAKNGYKFLGWQNGWKHVYFDKDGNQTTDDKNRRSFGYLKEDYPEYCNCIELKHPKIEVRVDRRGSENIVSCPVCKIYYKYDSSD